MIKNRELRVSGACFVLCFGGISSKGLEVKDVKRLFVPAFIMS